MKGAESLDQAVNALSMIASMAGYGLVTILIRDGVEDSVEMHVTSTPDETSTSVGRSIANALSEGPASYGLAKSMVENVYGKPQ